ncbi:pentatricopeptide repeat-containing protein [Carex littledalei]|uniref:Pentatricopeptide repeat-containing protein n=1 Tax=Carex littledalei TaxID=544730 RepID=A0A833VDR8_9POAL|nr:pentatricopeptide repeat-containing protein [Carex littledalei]
MLLSFVTNKFIHRLCQLSFSSSLSLTNQALHLATEAQSSFSHTESIPTPSPVTSNCTDYQYYLSFLQLCVTQNALKAGKRLHARLLLSGLGFNTALATKLVNLYCTCNCLPHAHSLFDKISKRNVFLWNILIRAYAWNGPYETAIVLYYQMLDHGIEPDNFTFPFVLKACSALSDIGTGRDIHKQVLHTRWCSDVYVGAGLIDMYSKCGCVNDAWQVFNKVLDRDVVLWNSMIAAYSQNGHPRDAIILFRDMVYNKVQPTIATLVTVISALAEAAALPRGREIHGFALRYGFGAVDKFKTALLDMYAKSGRVQVARKLFDQLLDIELASWNAMICGYGMHGHAHEAILLFDIMRKEGKVPPNHITFVGVLSACNHGGLMKEGEHFFHLMVNEYSIEPTLQHYTCLINLLGHFQRLGEAYGLIQNMPMKPDSGVWGALLNGCKVHQNVELGELALQKLIELEPTDAGNYVLLSNIYAQSGKWREAARVRKQMKKRGLKKVIASSWIEIKGITHAFLSGDTSHPFLKDIYKELERLEGFMNENGYVPNTNPVYHDVGDDEKCNMVRTHSERLAIAYGIISTPPGTRLLVTKNLRVCEDCHVAIKLISRIVEREIVVRDVNRYHCFVNGNCSCGDYW